MSTLQTTKSAFFRASITVRLWTGSILIAVALGLSPQSRAADSSTAVFTNYHSWSNAVSLNNGVVEALIVPTIGRVQQFRFLGDTNGVFWEDPATLGQSPSRGYKFFGGDRAWPSPQAAWGWPPPRGFDGSTNEVSFTNGVVTLTTPVDARFGIRSTRTIELLPSRPVMQIRTTFERVSSSTRTNDLGIWIDCMAVTPGNSRCYVPVPSPSIFSDGYTTNGSTYFTADLPAGFKHSGGLISFEADGKHHKLGFDGGTLVIVGPDHSLRLDAPRVSGASYPDGNSSTEVYTADGYFELELLGPLAQLPVGGKMEYITVYNLFRRTETTTDAEAQKVLSGRQ